MHQSVKQHGSKSGLSGLIWLQTVCKVISRRQNSPLTGKELNILADISNWAIGLNFGLSLHLHLYIASSKALASLPVCTGSPEPSLLDNVMSTKISFAGPYIDILIV